MSWYNIESKISSKRMKWLLHACHRGSIFWLSETVFFFFFNEVALTRMACLATIGKGAGRLFGNDWERE